MQGSFYDYSDKIMLSASIIDLGFIRWKSNINRFEAEGSFTFQGFDLSQYAPGTDDLNYSRHFLIPLRLHSVLITVIIHLPQH